MSIACETGAIATRTPLFANGVGHAECGGLATRGRCVTLDARLQRLTQGEIASLVLSPSVVQHAAIYDCNYLSEHQEILYLLENTYGCVCGGDFS